MKTNIVTDISPPISCLAKSWFSSYRPKCCWPIKLQDSFSRGKKKEVSDKVYFCHGDKHQSFLQVDTIRWKLYFKKIWCLLELGIS